MNSNARWMTIRETSQYLKIHEVTCRRYIRDGILPFTKIGRRSIRIDQRDVDQTLEKGKFRSENK